MADLASIQFKRIITTKVRPTAAQLLEGELAINLADGRIYTKDNSNIVKSLSDFAHGGVITNNFPYDNILSPGFYYDTNLASSTGKPSTEVTGTGYLLVFNTMDTSNESNVVVSNPGSVTTQMFIGGLSGYVWTRTKPTLTGAWTDWTRPIYNGDPVNLKDTIALEATNAANGSSLIFKNAAGTTIGYIKYVEATGLMFNAGVHTMTLNKTSGNLVVPGAVFEGTNRVYSPNNIPTTDVIWEKIKTANGDANLVTEGQWKTFAGPWTNYPVLTSGNTNLTGIIECTKTNNSLFQKFYSANENNIYTRVCNGGTWSTWRRLITIDTTELTKLTQISSSGLNVTGSVTTPTVNATVGVSTSQFNSDTPYKFYNATTGAQSIMTGGVLASSAFSDISKVPTNGIYSKGNILTIGTVTAPTFIGALTGNADSATRLQTARTLSWTGDATGSLSFNGTANVSAALTLSDTGVGAGTYQSVTVDTKGRVTAANTVVTGLITSSSTANTTSVATSNTNTYLNVVENTGGTLTSTGASIQVTGAGTITVTSDVAGKLTITGSQTITGNAATATRLQTARTINGVSFDGTANIEVPIKTIRTTAIEMDGLSESVFFRSDAGAGTLGIHIHNPVDSRYAYQLSQDSSYNSIGLKARVKSAGTWSDYKSLAFTDSNITGSAASLTTARTFTWTGDATGSLSFDGTANVSAALTLSNSGVTAGTYKSVTVDAKGRVTGGNDVITGLITSTTATGTANVATTNTNTFLNITEKTGSTTSTVGSSSQITGAGTVTVASDAAGKITITGSQTITGNAATATKLATARLINNTPFDGSANITLAEAVFSGFLANYVLSDYNNFGNNGFSVKYGNQTAVNKPTGTDHAVITSSYSTIWAVQQAYDWRTNRQYNRVENNGVWGAWRTVAYLDDDITGNAASADTSLKLTNARTLSWAGDATGSLSFDGTSDVSATLTLANSGVVAGTYKSVTVDAKGRVTAGNDVITGLITSTSATGITNVATTNTNTFLNITEKTGTAISTVGSSSQITGAGTVTVASDAAGKITITGSQTITGNAGSATILQTARTFTWSGDATGSLSFNGSANVSTSLTLANSGVTAGTYGDNINVPRFTVDAKGRVTSVINTSLRTATTGQTGIVQLNDNLTSTSTILALTANQGKVLKAEIDTKLSKEEALYPTLQTQRFTIPGVSGYASFKIILPVSYTANIVIELSGYYGGADATGKTIISGSMGANSSSLYHRDFRCTEAVGNISNIYYIEPTIYWDSTSNQSYFVLHKRVLTAQLCFITLYINKYNGSNLPFVIEDSTTEITPITNIKNTVLFNNDGNAGSATILQTARTLSWTGDATGSLSFNGSANVSTSLTLANTGVSAGTYKSVTVDSKGRVTGGNDVITGLITSTTATGTANVATTNTNTYLNITEKVGTAISTVGSSSQITGAGTVTVASDAAGKITITGSQTITGNAATATKLATARTINGVSFDGTANINVDAYWNTSLTTDMLTGNDTSEANKSGMYAHGIYNGIAKGYPFNYGNRLQIHGLGTAVTELFMEWAGDNTGRLFYRSRGDLGTHNWSAIKRIAFTDDNTASATILQTARTFTWTGDATGSLSFNGSANVSAALTLANSGVTAGTYKSVTVDAKGRVTAGNDVITGLITSTSASGTSNVATTNTNTFLNITEKVGTATSTVGSSSQITGDGTVTVASDANGKITITGSQTITGNAATATKLQTARTIGITGAVTATAANFDGTSNININATSLDATKLSGTVPNASLNGLYSNVTLDVSNGLVYSLKQPGSNNSVTAYGLGSIRATGTTQNSVIVIKTNIPKGSTNVLSLHIKGLSDSETTNIDITISGWIRGNISKLSLGTKDYIVRKADSSDGYLCFIISHPSGYLGTSTAFSIVTAHLNFGIDVSTLNNWTIFETTDLSTFTNISQPAPQSTSIANTYWDNVQSKPTTLDGYGITDTYTRTELDARYSLRTSGVKAITLSTTNLTYTNDNDVSTNVAVPTWNQSTTGNAATATRLQTARTINGVSFNGTANITIADSTKLPLAGGKMTGALENNRINLNSKDNGDGGSGILWYSTSNTTWQDYMGPAGSTGNGYSQTITAPTGVLVTSYGRRSLISAVAGYGWTFESGSTTTTTPNIVAEISYTGASRWSGAMAIAPASGTASLTLGSTSGTNTTYIDFMPAANTYIDARIQATGGSAANFGGTLTFSAASSVFGGTVTTSGAVSAGSLSVTGNATVNGQLTVNRFSSATAFNFYNSSTGAQYINTAGLLASNLYADASKVPAYGIYSKGNIVSGGTITATGGTLTGSLSITPTSGTASLTLGSVSGTNTTFIDFFPAATSTVDARIQATGGSNSAYDGNLTYYAKTHNIRGNINMPAFPSSWMQGTIGMNSAICLEPASASSWHAWFAQRTNGGNSFAVGVQGETWIVDHALKANIDSGSNTTSALLTVGADFAQFNVPVTAPTFNGSLNGNATTASSLTTARTLSWTGDATGSLSFNGSANASATLTLANTGVTAGTYKSVTVDSKGRVTAGTDVVTSLVTSTTASGTTNAATSNTNTFLNIVEKVGTANSSTGSSTQITGAGTVTVTSDTAGKLTITGSQTITGNAGSATKLQTARKINGTAFDGTTDIILDTNIFMGQVQWFNGDRAGIPDGWIAADGQLVNRADFPDLWRDVNTSFTKVDDAVWWTSGTINNRAAYSTGDGSTTFRVPDLNGTQFNSLKGLFLRGDGGGTIAGVAVNSGMVQGDAIRNITGQIGYGESTTSAPESNTTGAFSLTSTTNNYGSNGTDRDNRNWIFDASRVVPTADENRPVSAVGIWIIRARGTTNPLAPISGSPATLLANTFNGSQKIVGNLEVTGSVTLKDLTITGIANFGLGNVNQTWQDLTTSRALDTTYTNSTSNPIYVIVVNEYYNYGDPVKVFVNNLELLSTDKGNGNGWFGDTSFIVPPGQTYKVTKTVYPNLTTWRELR